MCRLYAMSANEPTRVECSLVHAQNALMQQSEQDAEGLMHGHGWGVADYRDGVPPLGFMPTRSLPMCAVPPWVERQSRTPIPFTTANGSLHITAQSRISLMSATG